MPDGPITDPEMLARIEEGLASADLSEQMKWYLRLQRDHGSDWQQVLKQERAARVLATEVPVVNVRAYRAWDKRRIECGLSVREARLMLDGEEWWQQTFRAWNRAVMNECYYWVFQPSAECCDGRDDHLMHLANGGGWRLRLVFSTVDNKPVLTAEDCGQTDSWHESKALDENTSDKEREDLEAIAKAWGMLTESYRSHLRRKWDGVPEAAPTGPPTAEENRQKRLKKLQAEAEKLGMDIVPKR